MKLTARIKSVPKLTAKFKELKMPLSGGFEEGYGRGYADGYEQGKTDGANDFNALLEGRLLTVTGNAKSVKRNLFSSYNSIIGVDLPLAETISNFAFYNCLALETANLPSAKVIGNNAFNGCVALTAVKIPLATSLGGKAFYGCVNLVEVDLSLIDTIWEQCFFDCSGLKKLILRIQKVCKLAKSDALSGTPIADGTGLIYVPGALVDQYKTATNWSTYASQFRAIEDYPEITGG